MSAEMPFGTIHDLRPIFDAALRSDKAALEAALDRLTDEEVAFLLDVSEFLRLVGSLKLSKRLAQKGAS